MPLTSSARQIYLSKRTRRADGRPLPTHLKSADKSNSRYLFSAWNHARRHARYEPKRAKVRITDAGACGATMMANYFEYLVLRQGRPYTHPNPAARRFEERRILPFLGT